MATSPGSFFVGMGTAFVILAAGFGGGLMFAKSAVEAPTSGSSRPRADQLPVARVILPTSAEAATPREQPVVASAPQAESAPPSPVVLPKPEVQQTAEKEKEKDRAVERAERRKPEAEERAHRKRVAERKARREAARVAKLQRDEQQQGQPGIMAFDDEQPRGGSLFGN